LETPNVHWSDIGGQHEIKRRLHNAVERPLKFADRMKILGLQPKKGVLLYGPPGCSKTLLVRALATEAGLNFLAVKGAELISMYVGESERATREVFRKARAASPSIIFFDEIDAIASRGRSGSDLNVLTTLLNEMDGFEELRNVLVVAATNKPQNIDPALMRPGRFDNVVYIGPPDLEARREIFQKRLEKVRYEDQDKNVEEFATITQGFSGAEVVAICQTAGEYAFDADREFITSGDVMEAIKNTPKSITREMLFEFESWNAARMR
jgi:AAA family ATPase